jgi:hypothetical protein
MVDMMSSLFGNTFVSADYPHSMTIGSFLTLFNPDLSCPILIAVHGSFSRHIPLSDLDDLECNIANLHTSHFNPSQRTLLMKIQDSNFRLLTSWTPDYLPLGNGRGMANPRVFWRVLAGVRVGVQVCLPLQTPPYAKGSQGYSL